MRRLYQLIHVSDLHVAPVRGGIAARMRERLLFASRLPIAGAPITRLMQGTAGYDPTAIVFLEKALEKIKQRDKHWLQGTRIVATGDLSTWGDASSFAAARGHLRRLSQNLHIPEPVIVYGNHDVWPGTMPLLVPNSRIGSLRSQFRNRESLGPWPLGPIAPSIGLSASGQLSLYSLNTVQHERWTNFLALGFVKQDRYWETHAGLPNQLAEMKRRSSKPDVRLVLTHHPIFDPEKPVLSLKLENGPDVAYVLHDNCPSHSGRPIAYVVLSGHTHELFPAINALPPVLSLSPHGTKLVADGDGQLIVGTLSQIGWGRRPPEHRFQLIRLWEDSSKKPAAIVLERIVYERSNRKGPFRPVGINDGINIAEQMEFP